MKKALSVFLSMCLLLAAMPFTAYAIEQDVTPPEIHIDTLTMTLPDGKEKVIVGDKVKLSLDVTDEGEVKTVELLYHQNDSDRDEFFYADYNETSGRFETEIEIDKNTVSGKWQLYRIYVQDDYGNYAYYYSSACSTATPNSDLSAYDFTVAESCMITFDTRGGNKIEPIYVEKGTLAQEVAKPKRDGFEFSGWYSDENMNNSFYFSSDKVNSDLTLYARWYIPFSISNWNKTSSAEGEGGMFKIGEYIMGYGCVNMGFDEEGAVLDLNAKPLIGYVFDGWYKGVYTGTSSSQSATPLDLDNPENLLSENPDYSVTVDKKTVVIAVFEECPKHIWDEGRVVTEPNCGRTGKKVYTCTNCGITYDEELPKAGSHNFDGGVVTKKATPTSTGVKTYTCKICGEKKNTVIPKTAKYNNTLTVKAKKPTVKFSKLKKKKQTLALKKWATVSKAQGKVTYKKSKGNKKITVAKNGRITVKKGLKKGIYKVKIKVTAAGNANYKSASKTVTLKIKVK